MEKVLIIAAHPDDEVLGMGGTIAKLVEEGSEVALLIVTDGSSSQYRTSENIESIIECKKKETADSARILGISSVFYGELPDMKLDTIPHVVINETIEKIIESFQPSVVFTHFYGDVNKDHKCVYESSIVACRPTNNQCVRKLLCYFVPSSTEWNIQNANNVFMANYYVKLSSINTKKKYDAMSCYTTELRAFPHPRSLEFLEIQDKCE